MNRLSNSIVNSIPHNYLFILLFAAILYLPFLGDGHFYSKGEPREALTAQSMLKTGNWILPDRYDDEFATKPPLTHWLIALFSLPKGEVSELSARLPSALASIAIATFFFLFLAKRGKSRIAMLACVLLLGCMEWAHTSISARVDLVLTAFMVGAMLQMYRWEEDGLKGIPWLAALFTGLATLTKGPVGIVLPCFVFFIYLLVIGRKFWHIVWALCKVALLGAVLPLLWYVAAYLKEGDYFLTIVYQENIARFTGKMSIGGTHEAGVLYMLGTVIAGMLPWMLLVIMSVTSIKYMNLNPKGFFKRTWLAIKGLPKVHLFCLVAIFAILLFYAIPASKRSVYQLPAYPFICFFLAEYFLFLIRKNITAWRIFSITLLSLIGIVLAFLLCNSMGLINIEGLKLSPKMFAEVQFYLDFLKELYTSVSVRGVVLTTWVVILFAWLIYILYKKRNRSLIQLTLALFFGFLMYYNMFFQTALKDKLSNRNFAKEAAAIVPESQPIYAYVDQFYVINYYTENRVKTFNPDNTNESFILIGERRYQEFMDNIEGKGTFEVLLKTPHPYAADTHQNVMLVKYEPVATISE